MRNCIACNAVLDGNQRMYCSNRCKQVIKNQNRAEQHAAMLAENAKLQRKVKRLESKIRKLEAA